MRKIVLMLSAAMFLTAASFAQDGKSLGFGVKAGANFANLSIDPDDDEFDTEMKIGIHGGAFVNLPLGSTFAIQPELVYSAEGAKQGEDDFEFSYNLGYLNVPIMFQYTASGFYAETGPQIGFLMSAKAKVEFDGEEEEEDVKDDFESTNFSWGIGLGYRLPNGVGIGARYNLGLSNILKESGDTKLKSNVIQLGLSYTFGGK